MLAACITFHHFWLIVAQVKSLNGLFPCLSISVGRKSSSAKLKIRGLCFIHRRVVSGASFATPRTFAVEAFVGVPPPFLGTTGIVESFVKTGNDMCSGSVHSCAEKLNILTRYFTGSSDASKELLLRFFSLEQPIELHVGHIVQKCSWEDRFGSGR